MAKAMKERRVTVEGKVYRWTPSRRYFGPVSIKTEGMVPIQVEVWVLHKHMSKEEWERAHTLCCKNWDCICGEPCTQTIVKPGQVADYIKDRLINGNEESSKPGSREVVGSRANRTQRRPCGIGRLHGNGRATGRYSPYQSR